MSQEINDESMLHDPNIEIKYEEEQPQLVQQLQEDELGSPSVIMECENDQDEDNIQPIQTRNPAGKETNSNNNQIKYTSHGRQQSKQPVKYKDDEMEESQGESSSVESSSSYDDYSDSSAQNYKLKRTSATRSSRRSKRIRGEHASNSPRQTLSDYEDISLSKIPRRKTSSKHHSMRQGNSAKVSVDDQTNSNNRNSQRVESKQQPLVRHRTKKSQRNRSDSEVSYDDDDDDEEDSNYSNFDSDDNYQRNRHYSNKNQRKRVTRISTRNSTNQKRRYSEANEGLLIGKSVDTSFSPEIKHKVEKKFQKSTESQKSLAKQNQLAVSHTQQATVPSNAVGVDTVSPADSLVNMNSSTIIQQIRNKVSSSNSNSTKNNETQEQNQAQQLLQQNLLFQNPSALSQLPGIQQQLALLLQQLNSQSQSQSQTQAKQQQNSKGNTKQKMVPQSNTATAKQSNQLENNSVGDIKKGVVKSLKSEVVGLIEVKVEEEEAENNQNQEKLQKGNKKSNQVQSNRSSSHNNNKRSQNYISQENVIKNLNDEEQEEQEDLEEGGAARSNRKKYNTRKIVKNYAEQSFDEDEIDEENDLVRLKPQKSQRMTTQSNKQEAVLPTTSVVAGITVDKSMKVQGITGELIDEDNPELIRLKEHAQHKEKLNVIMKKYSQRFAKVKKDQQQVIAAVSNKIKDMHCGASTVSSDNPVSSTVQQQVGLSSQVQAQLGNQLEEGKDKIPSVAACSEVPAGVANATRKNQLNAQLLSVEAQEKVKLRMSIAEQYARADQMTEEEEFLELTVEEEEALPKYGHFRFGDKPVSVLSSKIVNGNIFMEIGWEARRKSGIMPSPAILSTSEIKAYNKDFLLEYYEVKILQANEEKYLQLQAQRQQQASILRQQKEKVSNVTGSVQFASVSNAVGFTQKSNQNLNNISDSQNSTSSNVEDKQKQKKIGVYDEEDTVSCGRNGRKQKVIQINSETSSSSASDSDDDSYYDGGSDDHGDGENFGGSYSYRRFMKETGVLYEQQDSLISDERKRDQEKYFGKGNSKKFLDKESSSRKNKSNNSIVSLENKSKKNNSDISFQQKPSIDIMRFQDEEQDDDSNEIRCLPNSNQAHRKEPFVIEIV